ncbi:hypothetical protein [Bacillus sp. FJAT-28004]|nr:hypothetical protein [Bacillus sp. FJAT-28004]
MFSSRSPVDKLEESGFAVRKHKEQDHRAVVLDITGKGEENPSVTMK